LKNTLLREYDNWLQKESRLSIWGGSPDLHPSQSVIDAVKLAMDDENASIPELSGLPNAKSMADFYLNNYDVVLNPNNEILPLMGSKGIMHISLLLNEGDEVLIPIRISTYTSVTNLVERCLLL
jgi:aspartate/methionine/tyrosine aminotransferase